LRLRDVISPTLGIRDDEPAGRTLERMRSFDIAHVIVTRGSAIHGVVSEADLERACTTNAEGPIGDLATEVPILDSEAPIEDAAKLMRERKVGCVPVVEGDAIAGVVTIEKLLDLLGQGVVQTMRRRR